MTERRRGPTGPPASEGMDPLVRFAENLLRIRQARKFSQETLAERAGMDRTQISLLESGRRQPKFETLSKLAGALDVSVSLLFEGVYFERSLYGGEIRASRPPELPRASTSEPSE